MRGSIAGAVLVVVAGSIGCAPKLRARTAPPGAAPAPAFAALTVLIPEQVGIVLGECAAGDVDPVPVLQTRLRKAVIDALAGAGFRLAADAQDAADLHVAANATYTDCFMARSGRVVVELRGPAGALVDSGSGFFSMGNYENGATRALEQLSASGLLAHWVASRRTMGAPGPDAPKRQAQRPKLTSPARIAVLPLKPVGTVDPAVTHLVSGNLLSALAEVENLTTVGHDDIEAVLGIERQKEALGCDSLTCMAELGGALGVQYVLYGEIGKLGSKYNLNVSLVRASDASVLMRGSYLLDQREEELPAKLPEVVDRVVAKLQR